METKFNVFEVLEIAEQVEHKGATFYLKSAEKFENEDLRELFFKLASWKAKHERIWARMRKRFSEKTGEFGTFDPDNYILSNPEVMAGLTWFGTRQAFRGYTGQESKQQIIRDAINRANEVIIFYNGLKDFARDPASKDTIDRIIKEEERQITLLLKEMQTPERRS